MVGAVWNDVDFILINNFVQKSKLDKIGENWPNLTGTKYLEKNIMLNIFKTKSCFLIINSNLFLLIFVEIHSKFPS